MKYLMILTIGVCLLLTSVPVMADQAADEAAIRKVVEQGYAAMNKHDAKAMLELSVEDFETWSEETKGRAALMESWSKMWERQKGDQRKMTEELSIKFITPNVAIHKHRQENTGRVDEDGKALPPRMFLEALVLVKKEGKWLMAANYWMITDE